MVMVQLSKDSLDNEEIIGFLKQNLEFKEVYQKILSKKVIALGSSTERPPD